MSSAPLVSVLMTSYNREKYISAAIESVLASSFKDFELIICDDASNDRTVEIARSFAAADPRVKISVNSENLGDYNNRNQTASLAKAKYIKYVDADDILYYYGLEVMLTYMLRYPEAGFGLSSNPDVRRPYPVFLNPVEAYTEHFTGNSHFHRAPGSSIIRLDAFREVGGFSGERMIGDLQLWLKMGRYYPMVKLPFDMYWNRIHEGQESKSEYARKNYGRLTNRVTKEALMHPDCPLSGPQKRDALKSLNYSLLRRIRKRLF
jgi:glycosyltransferase involved in cell wall biosynthesis